MVKWARWEEEIAALKSFAVPRYMYKLPCETLTKELVVFRDASEEACAAAIYIRAAMAGGVVVSHLLIAKTCLMLLKPM